MVDPIAQENLGILRTVSADSQGPGDVQHEQIGGEPAAVIGVTK